MIFHLFLLFVSSVVRVASASLHDTQMTDTTFSSSGADAIARQIDVDVGSLPNDDLEEVYEIERTTATIIAGGYRRVSLTKPFVVEYWSKYP